MALIDTTECATASDSVLRRQTKLLWGVAGLGIEALRQSRTAWLVYFYAPPSDAGHAARLSLVVVSLLLFGGKLIEAFADTLIGYWSDRTSSRLGRRLPFILLASPPMALFAVLLFAPPARLHSGGIALYFFFMLELFILCNSLVSVPYEALMPEIARTSEERVSLSGWRVFFGVIGAGVGLIGSGLLISAYGYWAMALVMALLSLGGRYIGLAAIWKRARRDTPPTPLAFRTTLRFTLANRPFLIFLLSSVLFSTALAMLIGLLPYFVSSVLRKDDTGVWASVLTAVGIGSMTLALPFFAWLARRTSNQRAYLVAMLASSLAFPVLFFAGQLPGLSRETQALLALVIVGAPLAGVYLFPGPIIADLCDDEARRHGVRREGMFFSAQSFMDKVTEAFAPLLLGLILLLGNSRDNLLGIRLVGPLAGLVVFSGYLLFRASYRRNER
jgi:GPH family glycoside/pentoside/hexuronide:cation symporter